MNGAVYEWSAHAPLAIKAGIESEVLEAVKDLGRDVFLKGRGAWEDVGTRGGRSEGGLDKRSWAVVAYTDQMTREIAVEDDLFEGLKEWFGEQQIVELTATVATYNCVSRFLVALDVCEMNGQEIKMPEA